MCATLGIRFCSPMLRAQSVNQHCKDRVRGRSVWRQYFFIHGVAGSPYDNQCASALAAVPRSTIPRTCKIICLTLRHRGNLPVQSAHIVAVSAARSLAFVAKRVREAQGHRACALGFASDIPMSKIPLLKITKALTSGSFNATT